MPSTHARGSMKKIGVLTILQDAHECRVHLTKNSTSVHQLRSGRPRVGHKEFFTLGVATDDRQIVGAARWLNDAATGREAVVVDDEYSHGCISRQKLPDVGNSLFQLLAVKLNGVHLVLTRTGPKWLVIYAVAAGVVGGAKKVRAKAVKRRSAIPVGGMVRIRILLEWLILQDTPPFVKVADNIVVSGEDALVDPEFDRIFATPQKIGEQVIGETIVVGHAAHGDPQDRILRAGRVIDIGHAVLVLCSFNVERAAHLTDIVVNVGHAHVTADGVDVGLAFPSGVTEGDTSLPAVGLGRCIDADLVENVGAGLKLGH